MEIKKSCGNCKFYYDCAAELITSKQPKCNDLSEWKPDYQTLESELQQYKEEFCEIEECIETMLDQRFCMDGTDSDRRLTGIIEEWGGLVEKINTILTQAKGGYKVDESY